MPVKLIKKSNSMFHVDIYIIWHDRVYAISLPCMLDPVIYVCMYVCTWGYYMNKVCAMYITYYIMYAGFREEMVLLFFKEWIFSGWWGHYISHCTNLKKKFEEKELKMASVKQLHKATIKTRRE